MPGLACAGGDSGGPVFSETIAMGILKGGVTYGDSIGECPYIFYMSVDYIDSLNIELIYDFNFPPRKLQNNIFQSLFLHFFQFREYFP